MNYHTGADIIEIERIDEAVARWGERFLRRIYTDAELELYRNHLPSLAARFAGKEAVIKALNPIDSYVNFRDIEILSESSGKPSVVLHGKAQKLAKSISIDNIDISLSHCREYAIAFVIAVSG